MKLWRDRQLWIYGGLLGLSLILGVVCIFSRSINGGVLGLSAGLFFLGAVGVASRVSGKPMGGRIEPAAKPATRLRVIVRSLFYTVVMVIYGVMAYYSKTWDDIPAVKVVIELVFAALAISNLAVIFRAVFAWKEPSPRP